MYVGQENADSVAVIDVGTQQVVKQIPIGQAPQALVFVANAVPTGTGTANMTRQNVGLRIERRPFAVPGAPDAKGKAVIRSLGAVDAVELSVRGAPAGTMVDAYAVQNMAAPYGRAVKLAHLMVKADGAAESAAQLRFFESGFTNVVPAAPGQLPSGATLALAAAVPVLQVAVANHCSIH